MKVRKKPVIVDAVQWSGSNWHEVLAFADFNHNAVSPDGDQLVIVTLEGTMRAMPGDWVIRGVNGEVYPCKPGIFDQTYEFVDEQEAQPPPDLSESLE